MCPLKHLYIRFYLLLVAPLFDLISESQTEILFKENCSDVKLLTTESVDKYRK